MTKEKKYMGVRVPSDLRSKIKKLADDEYEGNESMAVKEILQKFFVKKVKQK